MYDIVGIDMPCVDFVLNIPTMPKPNSSMHFHRLSFQGGNKVSTGMVTAARLGAKCAMLGAVGDDQFGRFCVDDFTRHGIDSMLKIRKGETTALSFVLSDDETRGRSIVYHPGNCARMSIDELPISVLENTKYFYLAWLDDTVLYAVKTSKAAGAKIFVDADKPTKEIIDNIPMYDIFIASEFVYDSMFDDKNYEENCRKALKMGPEIVVFTLGSRGCCGISRDGAYFRLDSYHVDVVDTVGAGDVFHGAYLAALIRGMSARDAAQFSSAVSAIKCTRIGGRAGIPNYETTINFMQTGHIDYTEIDERVRFYEKGPG
jgi:sulfofructose kinase